MVAVDFDTAMTRIKKTVFKQRIRVKDFFVDFDRLNSGYVHPNHFLSALSQAGTFSSVPKVDAHATQCIR